MYLQQPAMKIGGLLLLAAPSIHAATCVNSHGANTVSLGTAGIKGIYRNICDSMWRGHTSSTVQDEHVKCTGYSSKGTYKFCDMALENIASQCSGVTEGSFEYHWDGNNENYHCQGFVGGGGCDARKREADPGKSKPGNPCNKLRARGEGKIWDDRVEGEEGQAKRATEWAA